MLTRAFCIINFAFLIMDYIAFGYGRVSTTKQGRSREARTETFQRAAVFQVAASRESAADFAP